MAPALLPPAAPAAAPPHCGAAVAAAPAPLLQRGCAARRRRRGPAAAAAAAAALLLAGSPAPAAARLVRRPHELLEAAGLPPSPEGAEAAVLAESAAAEEAAVAAAWPAPPPAAAAAAAQPPGAIGIAGADLSVASAALSTCASLKNHITHSTVQISVGTPPQHFDVVADTGSDSVIVTSCACVRSGRCQAGGKCFEGVNKSSTFTVEGQSGPLLAMPDVVPVVVLTFGSGEIEAMIATDIVQVGAAQAAMPDGLLLMVDQALRISGPFEGILGLGLPRKGDEQSLLQRPAGRGKDAGAFSGGRAEGSDRMVYESLGFLEAAGVPRFSICFNDGGRDGVLRLGGPPADFQLGSVGQVHWGVDFRGVTVGDSSLAVRSEFCDPSAMRQGQLTPCGAIPDSGTTVIMAPQAHLKELFTLICDGWAMCVEESQAMPRVPKYQVLQLLLERCEDWADEVGFSGLPTLTFHVAGAAGRTQALRLPPEAYILEVEEEEVHYVRKYLMGVLPVRVPEAAGRSRRVCMPAFGEQEYETEQNGPVWIFGTPFFYEFQVGYDLRTEPPSVSFRDEPCGACANGAAEPPPPALLTRRQGGGATAWPRRISGPLRVPALNTSEPL